MRIYNTKQKSFNLDDKRKNTIMLLAKMICLVKMLQPPAPKTICNITEKKCYQQNNMEQGYYPIGKSLLPAELRKKIKHSKKHFTYFLKEHKEK